MSDAKAKAVTHWEAMKIGAANLNLAIIVEGTATKLKHLKREGEPGRPSQADIDKFRSYLSRHKDDVFLANGVSPEDDPVATDARRLKRWLEAHASAPECVLTAPDGRRIVFREERAELLRSYREDHWWVIRAAGFHSAVANAKGFEVAQNETR